MTIIVNTPPKAESTDSGAGWIVAVIILLAVVSIGAFIWFYYYQNPPAKSDTTNINVTLPNTPAPVNTPSTQ